MVNLAEIHAEINGFSRISDTRVTNSSATKVLQIQLV